MSFKAGLVADSGGVFYRADAAEFCVPIVHAGGDSVCYFDQNWSEITGENISVSEHIPTARIHKPYMPTLAVGDPVTIDAVVYTVRDIQIDAGQTGDAILVLSV